MFQAVEMSSRIMRLPRFSRLPIFLLAAALVASKVSAQGVAPVPAPSVSPDAALKKDVEFLSKLPSRVPGTPGNLQAAEYVKTRFNQIGLENVKADSYLVTAPV